MEEIRRIKRELRSRGAIVDFYADTMALPNGHMAQWDFIDHKGAAAVVPVLDDGRILMVRQYRNALERDTLEIPAGSLNEPGEPKIDCARRELEEETGYQAGVLEPLLTIHTTVAFCNEQIGIFVARDLIPTKQRLDEDEFVDVQAYRLEELMEMISAQKLMDAKTVSALLAYQLLCESRK